MFDEMESKTNELIVENSELKNKNSKLNEENNKLIKEINMIKHGIGIKTLNSDQLSNLYKTLKSALHRVVETKFDMLESATTCIVCYDRQRNQFFDPCGHMVCCSYCAQLIDQCPMCNAHINHKKIVFQ